MLRHVAPLAILVGLIVSLAGCCKSGHHHTAQVILPAESQPVVQPATAPAADPIPSTSPATQPVADAKLAADAVICRIALVSDTHIALGPNYAPYVDRFQQVIQQVNASDADVVLLSGDLCQDPVPAWQVKFHEMVGQIEKPTLFVPGNHDIGNKPLGDAPSKVTAEFLTQYKTNIGELWFSKQVTPQVRVIGFSSTVIGSKLPEETQQWDFLQSELAKTTPGYTLLLTHIPVFSSNINEEEGYNNINRPDRQRLWNLITQGKVLAILSGHLHFPLDLKVDGITFVGAPAVSFGQDPNGKKVGWRSVVIHADGSLTTELHYFAEPANMASPDPAPSK